MIVMPMGPDYALAFGAPMENVPFVGASYILAASLTAFFSARFLDRFERRRLLAGVLFGLSISEALATLSWSFEALPGFRALAGVFGGLATSLGMAVLAEVVPDTIEGEPWALWAPHLRCRLLLACLWGCTWRYGVVGVRHFGPWLQSCW